MSKRFFFQIGSNKYNKNPGPDDPDRVLQEGSYRDRVEFQQRVLLAELLHHLSGGSHAIVQNPAPSEPERESVDHVWTYFGQKSGGMHTVYKNPLVHKLTHQHIEDRNATTLQLKQWSADMARLANNPNIAMMNADRDTSNTDNPTGEHMHLIEQGGTSSFRGYAYIWASGWGSSQRVLFGEALKALSHPKYPVMPLGGMTKATGGLIGMLFGLVGAPINLPHQSEDQAAANVTVHTMTALGYKPKFVSSKAFWTKMRESNVITAAINAATRWSAGRTNLEDDPYMQRIFTFSGIPLSERFYYTNMGRFYLANPVGTFMNILMPFAIYFDLSPL